MKKPLGYVTKADIRAADAPLIAAYLARGGTIAVCPVGRG